MPKHYSPQTFRAGDSIGYLLKRAHSLLLAQAEAAFEHHELTFTQYIMLLRVRDGFGNTPSELCRDFVHDSGALTRLLERSRSRADRRMVELSLTRAGRDVLQSVIPIVVDKLNWATQDFSAEEFVEFKRLIRKLMARLETAQPQDEPAVKAPVRKALPRKSGPMQRSCR